MSSPSTPPPPLAHHSEAPRDKLAPSSNCRLLRLLLLLSRRPGGHTPDPLDYAFSWHLLSVLQAIGVVPPDCAYPQGGWVWSGAGRQPACLPACLAGQVSSCAVLRLPRCCIWVICYGAMSDV